MRFATIKRYRIIAYDGCEEVFVKQLSQFVKNIYRMKDCASTKNDLDTNEN